MDKNEKKKLKTLNKTWIKHHIDELSVQNGGVS